MRTLRSRENLTAFDVACLLLTIFGVVSGKQAIYAYRQQIRQIRSVSHRAQCNGIADAYNGGRSAR